VDAQTALGLGLVDRVEPADRCVSALGAWIGRLARVNGDAVAIWKRATLALPAPGSTEGARLTIERLSDAGVRDRVRRFVETGEPPWMVEER
jgi:enoyl-CoA hydratase/carnithine racemase